MADWLEYYATALELDVWTSTKIVKVEQNPETLKWTVDVERANGGKRTFVVNHIVGAIGLAGGKPRMPVIPGRVCTLSRTRFCGLCGTLGRQAIRARSVIRSISDLERATLARRLSWLVLASLPTIYPAAYMNMALVRSTRIARSRSTNIEL